MATQTLIKQEHSDGCGAACLAMILGITYEKARAKLPSYTTLAEMKAELSKHNVELKCLLLLVGDDAKQHWVLKIENLYFDPAMMFIKRKLNKKYAGVLAELAL